MNRFQLPPKAADILKEHAAAAYGSGDPYRYLLAVGLGSALSEAGYNPKEAYEKSSIHSFRHSYRQQL